MNMENFKSFLSDITAPVRKKAAEKALKRQLLSIKEAAKEYEKAKLPAGHPYYHELLTQANDAIHVHCERWAEQEQAVRRTTPFLYNLEKKANGEASTGSLGKTVAACFGVLLLCAGVGAALGLGNGVFHQVVKWFGA